MNNYPICTPRTVVEVFSDFRARRAGLIKALTTDFVEVYGKCDPEKENLCLFAHPNERWEVTLPAKEVPPELPEPALGINFARDGMHRKEWLAMVAVHSDAWLLAVAFYFGARFQFDKSQRKNLFNQINELPSIFEVVSSSDKNQHSSVSTNSSNKSKSNSKLKGCVDKEEDEDGNEHDKTLCGVCGEHYAVDGFWIFCDLCEQWFHGKCVKITPARAKHIKQYKCPTCSNKKARC